MSSADDTRESSDTSDSSDTTRLAQARTLGMALAHARALLANAGSTPTPDLDGQVLLAHVTGSPRATLVAFPERALDADVAARYASLVARRARGEPVAYLIGHREFFGLDFLVDARVLVPRPETELLVEAALADLRARLAANPSHPPRVADIGTGSGAIALALAVSEPRLPLVYATDVSADALALAGENARRLGVAERVRCLRGDLLAPLPEPVDVLVANLPYIAPADAATLPVDVRMYEPALALYGAEDGLGHLRRLLAAASAVLRPGASLYLEIGYDQGSAVLALARAAFPGADARLVSDYAGLDRVVRVGTSRGENAGQGTRESEPTQHA